MKVRFICYILNSILLDVRTQAADLLFSHHGLILENRICLLHIVCCNVEVKKDPALARGLNSDDPRPESLGSFYLLHVVSYRANIEEVLIVIRVVGSFVKNRS